MLLWANSSIRAFNVDKYVPWWHVARQKLLIKAPNELVEHWVVQALQYALGQMD